MGCTGKCCELFTFTQSKEWFKRGAQEGNEANGTRLEMQMIADMIVPLDQGRPTLENDGKKHFWFRCKHHDVVSGKCTIYDKRPVVCRIHPTKSGDKGICTPECTLTQGTPRELAEEEFCKAHGISPRDKYKWMNCQHAFTVRNNVHYLECEYCGAQLPTGVKICKTCSNTGWFWVNKKEDTRDACPFCSNGTEYKEKDPRYLKYLPKESS